MQIIIDNKNTVSIDIILSVYHNNSNELAHFDQLKKF